MPAMFSSLVTSGGVMAAVCIVQPNKKLFKPIAARYVGRVRYVVTHVSERPIRAINRRDVRVMQSRTVDIFDKAIHCVGGVFVVSHSGA